ncbi:MAG: hypothetical protein FK734_07030 [Asgard group archaeon]|nr:hypothetical protein [Asgard group archaeon]
MVENIERARQLAKSGSLRSAVEEFFKLIKELKSKKNYDEASRIMLEIIIEVEKSDDKRLIYLTAEKILEDIIDLKSKDPEFYTEINKFLAIAKDLYRNTDSLQDKSGMIAEAQIEFAKQANADPKLFYLEAAEDYSEWGAKLLTKPRIRVEDEKLGDEFITKATDFYKKSDNEEKSITNYTNIFSKHLENKNEDLAEKAIDKAFEVLLKLKLPEEKLEIAAELVMTAYVKIIEYRIPEILNPEFQTTKRESVYFDNNIAVRMIQHAKDVCDNRKVKGAIAVLAKELSLIGLAIFEKGLYREAIPYYEKAKDYYLDIGNKELTIGFGTDVISIGLQLFTDERYPIGRDYFNIAIDIGQKIDRKFEVLTYQKQAELFLKYKKFQLAFEAYRQMINPLLELPESESRIDIPSDIRQLALERFEKNDFHYAELFYRLVADFFLAFNQIELAADTYDSVWQNMFKVRQLQTGIDLASKAAETYKKAGKEEEAADVYFKLAKYLLGEGHFDIALERMNLAAETIPEELREQKFKPLVEIATKYSEQCIKSGDIINARELWNAACNYNEILARSLIKRDINAVVDTIEDHIKNVRKFDSEELFEVTLASAKGSGRVLSEAGEHDRAAKVMVSFATDFLRKNITEYADTLFEDSAAEFIKANEPEEAARILSALARYHSDHGNYDLSIKYYLKASIESGMGDHPEIYKNIAEHCFDTFNTLLQKGENKFAIKGFDAAIRINTAVNFETAANLSNEIAKKLFDNQMFEQSLKYYKQAIEHFLDAKSKHATIIAAEVVERGRKIIQKGMLEIAYEFLNLGIDTLYYTDQQVQAALTARIEGEKILESNNPELGLNLLNKAIEYYQAIKDQSVAAEIQTTIGGFYLRNNNLLEGLKYFEDAASIYLNSKQDKNLVKLIQLIAENAIAITSNKFTSTNPNEANTDDIGKRYFKLAEDFAMKINNIKLKSELLEKEWTVFSQELLHESAFNTLINTFETFIELNDFKKISNFAIEVTSYASGLIAQNDLMNATKYLNQVIDILMKTSKQDEAAAICIRICEVFLKEENNEVAVSWGLKAADIMSSIKLVNEAINFIEELVDQLMVRNSIENAILCYGKIAKILDENNRLTEVEETALKVMAFGTANMKSNNISAGLRLWEVALTIGAIVGDEFTGRLSVIEGQTFFEIKNYEKSIELFKESFSFFNRAKKESRLINLGNIIFDLVYELQKEKSFDIAFKFIPIAFESLSAGNEMMLATEKMFGNAKNFIEIGRDKEGFHLLNATIDSLFSKGDMTSGVERCFIGAAMLISYGKNVEGSRLIDKGMEKISQITDEASIKHLATVCRNQGIILRDDDKLEASHIILASGIGILRTINDLIGIGQISIDLGRTLIRRNEMSAAVEAFRNGVQLLAQGNLMKESLDIVNELITEGRKQIDNRNTMVGVPLVELSGELFIILGNPERIMVISEIFINLGGKMLNERNYEIAALYFSKAMELATQADLKDYLPKVGNRCIDFGLKLVKEDDPILGIQFMNAGADLISDFEDKLEKTSRATSNYIDAVAQVLSTPFEKSVPNEEERLELIGQFIDSTIKFFTKIRAEKSFERLSKILQDYGKKLLKEKEPKIVRRIFEPALRAAELGNHTKQMIDIANTYLDHVNYLIKIELFDQLETTLKQALNIYLEVNDHKEIRKFIGLMAHSGRELCLDEKTLRYGQQILDIITDLGVNLVQQDFYPVLIIPTLHLGQQAIELENYDLVLYARQNVIRLLRSIQAANLPLTILGNISLSNMIFEWYQPAEILINRPETYDQAIKIIDQSLQLAVITQQVELGRAVVDKVLEAMDNIAKRRTSGLEVLYEILASGLNGLNQSQDVIRLGSKCIEIGKMAAERKRLKESINYLKTAGRIFSLLQDERLIADVAIASATIGDQRLHEKNFKEGLYYYSAALENYELSQDEKSIQLIANSIEQLFKSTPPEDGYISFLVPGIIYANRDNIKQAESLAEKALKQASSMIKSGKKDLIYDSISYIFAATDIYERTGNFIEETRIYDSHMFEYLEAISETKIVDLFLDMLIRSVLKKLRIWDFVAIDNLFVKSIDNRVQKNKKFQAIKSSIDELKFGNISKAIEHANQVNVLYHRNLQEYIDNYRNQIKLDIQDKGKLSIHEYMENQPIAQLVNILIEELYARKEIEGKYFPIGLFVSSDQLSNTLNFLDKELQDNGKAAIQDIAKNTALTNDEALSVVRIEYIPQKFQAVLNDNQSILYSYLRLRNEVRELAFGYQEIGNVDINKISQQLRFPPETIQREIEYLILEGKINPRLVGRTK